MCNIYPIIQYNFSLYMKSKIFQHTLISLIAITSISCQKITPIGVPTLSAVQDQFAQNSEYLPQGRYYSDSIQVDGEVNSALDVLMKKNFSLCSTCEGMRYFAIRYGTNSGLSLNYVTVSSSCSGTINAAQGSGFVSRPGDNQLFISTQLFDESWLLESKLCPGRYIKATSSSNLALLSGKSSNARFWFKHDANHVHVQSAFYASSYWYAGLPIKMNQFGTQYVVEHWPTQPWP